MATLNDAKGEELFNLCDNADTMSAASLDEVKGLIVQGANLKWKNATGRTALMAACDNGHIEAAKEININATDNDNGSALMCKDQDDGHTKIVEQEQQAGSSSLGVKRKLGSYIAKLEELTAAGDAAEAEQVTFRKKFKESEERLTELEKVVRGQGVTLMALWSQQE
jgi:ankyrin repeat protein